MISIAGLNHLEKFNFIEGVFLFWKNSASTKYESLAIIIQIYPCYHLFSLVSLLLGICKYDRVIVTTRYDYFSLIYTFSLAIEDNLQYINCWERSVS